MSLNGITSAALSTLQTNSAALRTVSDNIANVNTPGYTRRVVNLEAQTSGGILTGVDIASIERVVDKFLSSETLSSTASSSRFDTQNSIFNQLNGLLGKPGDANSLTASLANITNVLGQAALSPTASASQQSVLDRLSRSGLDDLQPFYFDRRPARSGRPAGVLERQRRQRPDQAGLRSQHPGQDRSDQRRLLVGDPGSARRGAAEPVEAGRHPLRRIAGRPRQRVDQ